MHAGRQSNRYILSTHRAFIAQMLSLFSYTTHGDVTLSWIYNRFQNISRSVKRYILSGLSLRHSLSSPPAIYVSWLQTDLFYFSSCLFIFCCLPTTLLWDEFWSCKITLCHLDSFFLSFSRMVMLAQQPYGISLPVILFVCKKNLIVFLFFFSVFHNQHMQTSDNMWPT